MMINLAHNMAINQTIIAWLIVILHELNAEKSILFPIVVKHILLEIDNIILNLF